MILKPQENHFKRLPKDLDVLDITAMPLSPIVIIKSSGEISRDVDLYDEDSGDIAIFAWSGKWRTDVFIIDKKDLEKHYYAPMRERDERIAKEKKDRKDQKKRTKKC